METDKHYFRVGLYLFGFTLAAAVFAMWLTARGQGSDEKYRIYFAESVSGLGKDSAVKYRGVNVGTVESISINAQDTRLIQVDIKLRDSTPVKVDTLAGLKMQGITGVVYVELTAGTPEAKNLRDVTPKDEIPIIKAQASSIAALMNQLPQILDKLNTIAEHFGSLTGQMNKLVSDDNIKNLSTTFDNMAVTSGELRATLQETRGNVVSATEQMNGTMRNLRQASHNADIVTERIKNDPSSLLFPSEEEGVPAP